MAHHICTPIKQPLIRMPSNQMALANEGRIGVQAGRSTLAPAVLVSLKQPASGQERTGLPDLVGHNQRRPQPEVRQQTTFNSDRTIERRRSLSGPPMRIFVFDEIGIPLPDKLLKVILLNDRNAQVKRFWESLIQNVHANHCTAPEIIVDIFTDGAAILRRMNEIWKLRVRSNYSPRPLHLAISRTSQPALVRFEIERHGGHFLYLSDAPDHFAHELEQMRLWLSTLFRAMPCWQIVYEGQGKVSRTTIHLLGRRSSTRLPGSDCHIAVFAAMLRRNALPRSINEWRKILMEDPLFQPSGGGLEVPSRNTLKAYLHRDFPKYLQVTFNQQRSGHAASRIIERVKLDGKTVGYKIRGRCLPINFFEC